MVLWLQLLCEEKLLAAMPGKMHFGNAVVSFYSSFFLSKNGCCGWEKPDLGLLQRRKMF